MLQRDSDMLTHILLCGATSNANLLGVDTSQSGLSSTAMVSRRVNSLMFSIEIVAVRAGYQSLEANYKPAVTFAIVQRRHRTRSFPMRQEDGIRSGIRKPGLVADADIVHPVEFDFYLQRHADLLGTSRPAHYVVLLD
jgi:hypothetical protein